MRPECERVSLVEKLGEFQEYWSPKIIGELNGQYVKLTKVRGEFVWHQHDREDELFLVVSGELKLSLPDKEITLRAGEFAIVPRGTQHRPWSENEAHVLLFEPKSTMSMGELDHDRNTDGEWL